MPRENRKRGRRLKKQPEALQTEEKTTNHTTYQEIVQEPSWIMAPEQTGQVFDSEAPFGYVDADIKAYFRTADTQMRSWQESREDAVPNGEGDPNQERHLFFVAALTEMSGKEKQMATDPDCSVILERMLYSMDDFARRVFMDSLSGSFQELVKHRFASHVCQTLFNVASDTISRETRRIFPDVLNSGDNGELRLLTQLIQDCCQELLPELSSLLMDPFASHVLRSLLLLLSNSQSCQDTALLRSKKSATWKARQGLMKSMFSENKSRVAQGKSIPPEFLVTAREIIQRARRELGENEIRAFATNRAASPTLQVLLEVEHEQGLTDSSDSLLDIVTFGLIRECQGDSRKTVEPSDYLNALLRDTTSSHLFESIISYLPSHVFPALWSTYFEGRLGRLAAHPVANFVVAKALSRVDAEQLSTACAELKGLGSRLIRTSRVGVLRSLVDRSVQLGTAGDIVCQVLLDGFEFKKDEDKLQLVPCIMSLLTLEDYKNVKAGEKSISGPDGRKNTPLEPKIPGALLLQSVLQLPQPHCHLVVDSVVSLIAEERLEIAQHPISSRIYDAFLESPSITSKVKREFVMSFLGQFHKLVDDRIGSRVADRYWGFADTYLKEKIARSLINYESFLAGSYYGKFFAKNLHLYLLQHKPDEWKNLQSQRRKSLASNGLPHIKTAGTTTNIGDKPQGRRSPTKRKREEDEIDALFESNFVRGVKSGALTESRGIAESLAPHSKQGMNVEGKILQEVFSAIRSAPKSEGKISKKSKSKGKNR